MNNFNTSPEQETHSAQEHKPEKSRLALLRTEKRFITEDLQFETDLAKITELKTRLAELLIKEEELDPSLSKKSAKVQDITPKETIDWAGQDPDTLKRGANN